MQTKLKELSKKINISLVILWKAIDAEKDYNFDKDSYVMIDLYETINEIYLNFNLLFSKYENIRCLYKKCWWLLSEEVLLGWVNWHLYRVCLFEETFLKLKDLWKLLEIKLKFN
jgi:hypothetical protein